MVRKIYFYNTKIIETSTYLEVYYYEEPIFTTSDIQSNIKQDLAWLDTTLKKRKFDELLPSEKYDSLKRKQRHYEQMRWEVARIIDVNWDKNTKFVTLTFAENIADIDYCNNEFQKFIKRLKRRQTKRTQPVKYIATWEKQKRGSIHYHIIFFSLGYINKLELEKLWRNGFAHINSVDVDSKENRGRYLSKYFSKDLEVKEHKKKAFFKSQNLKMPTVRKITTSQVLDFSDKQIAYTKEYNRKTLNYKEKDLNYPDFKYSKVKYIKFLKE